ncbi:MAG: hypothetical protein N3G78_00940 [Desulfobacterota bacterium]|nr:hypothetical protein [Thermodesulfobacteriota bacterium]
MLKRSPVPPSFSLVRRGKSFLLLHDRFRELLLNKGVEDPETFCKNSLRPLTFLGGRTPHPVIDLGEGLRIVLRKYSHGGLLRLLTGEIFLFGARSFRELVLTEEVRATSIPTIQAVGAIHRVILWPFYRAFLLSMEVEGARDLFDFLLAMRGSASPEALRRKRWIIRSAGLLLQKFHNEGFYHRDLQLRNLLVAGDQVLIIDLDRSGRKKDLSLRTRIKNLLRLNRSIDKGKSFGLPVTRTDRWRFFLAYGGDDPRLRSAMKRALRAYRLHLALHRTGWLLKRRIGVSNGRSPCGENP